MKVELNEAEIKQVLVDYAGQRMGQSFNQVTFYFKNTGPDNPKQEIYSATIEWSDAVARERLLNAKNAAMQNAALDGLKT